MSPQGFSIVHNNRVFEITRDNERNIEYGEIGVMLTRVVH